MSREPTITETLRRVIEARLAEVHIALPGEVVSYDSAKQVADVRISVRLRVADGETEEETIAVEPLPDVPVAWPRGGGFYLHLGLSRGDTGLLVFSSRSLDRWLSSGSVVDPVDVRTHDLSDAVFFPGLSPSTNPIRQTPPTGVAAIGREGAALASPMIGETFEIWWALMESWLTGMAALVPYAPPIPPLPGGVTASKFKIPGNG